MSRYLVLAVLIIVSLSNAFGQDEENNALLLTGLIMDADQQIPLPYVNIRLGGTTFGTASDTNGHFTLFVSPGDTLVFSSVGYRPARFIMPNEVEGDRYSLIQLLRQETVMLSEVVVFPWPSVDQFKDAFLDTEVAADEESLVREVQLRVLGEVKENELNQYEADQVRYQRLYELDGIFPPNNFLNPMRWSDFIRDVGRSKKKE